MLKLSQKEIINILYQIRNGYCKENYLEYEEDLRGECYNVSDFAQEILCLKYDIKIDMIKGRCYGCEHYWLEYENYIIDLSIKQFESIAKKALPYIYLEEIQKSKHHLKECYVKSWCP